MKIIKTITKQRLDLDPEGEGPVPVLNLRDPNTPYSLFKEEQE